jgi:hypothetical protein
MQAYLKKHGPAFSDHRIKVDWQATGRVITLEFQVQKRIGPPWQTDEVFNQDWSKNWGLWNKDVVEAFLQLRQNPEDTTAPYLEIQISPLNQPFALIVTEPRKTFFAPKKLEYKSEVTLTDKLWTTKLEVTVPEEVSGDLLFGGFFACLGTNTREYYALNPNPEMNPDFHRPELFLSLVE